MAPTARTGLDDVDVVFLVHREAPGMLARHHAAVAATTGSRWRGRALLVENAAAPATSAAARACLAERYPAADRRVLSSPRNLGFARAMDLALDACRGRYVALVNSDGEPGAGMLLRLAEVLDAEPRAVWAAPAVHGPGEDDDPPGPPRPVAELGGTAVLVRRAEFLAAGGFDPAYFSYDEDRDASRRLRAAPCCCASRTAASCTARAAAAPAGCSGASGTTPGRCRRWPPSTPSARCGRRSPSSPAGRAPWPPTCATATCPGPPGSPWPSWSCRTVSSSPRCAGVGPGTVPGWPGGWTGTASP